jgi:hypothetical protein
MGLTDVPCELFHMKNVTTLNLFNNKLCSLPSEIAHLATLEVLFVRLSKRLDRDLTESHAVFLGHEQPAHISSARARSADQSQKAQCAVVKAHTDRDLTLRLVLSGRLQPAHVAAS